MKHNIVVLDKCFTNYPPFDFDYAITYYACTSRDQLVSRIRDCTIIITSNTRLTRDDIIAARNLQLVATNGTGTDIVDAVTLSELGIALCNVPAKSTESTSEHALALYYGLRRRLPEMHSMTVGGKVWPTTRDLHLKLHCHGKPPRTNAEEIMVIIGYGALGKRIESLGRALGMGVLIAERKGVRDTRPDRVPYWECLKRGTLFIIATPLNETTRSMISVPDLAVMDPTSLLVNIGRGSVVDNRALIDALRQGQIGGAAIDVYEEEPATQANSILLDSSIPNLLLSPHIGWYSSQTIQSTLLTQKANLDGFVSGHMVNVVLSPERKSNGHAVNGQALGHLENE